MMTDTELRRVATYARVSSDDQRDRATIQTQIEELERALGRLPEVEVVERYIDDGVSGMIPIALRPDGARLIRAGASGRFGELWVYDVDRLGRDAPDIMRARRDLAEIGTRIFTPAGEVPPLLFDLQAVIGDYARVQFLKRSADGMARAAREGRYTGGIVAFGYRAEGHQQTARYVPDTAPLSEQITLSAAAVVGQMYRRLAIDGWSCPQIAHELNALGVPTSYGRVERQVKRGQRKERTQGVWRSGRIRNIVIEPKYKGSLEYGRRSRRRREVIAASIEPLVSEALWAAAQDALARNRRVSRNTVRRYLLKSVITCATCGCVYVGSQGRPGVSWYRCGGKHAERGRFAGRCPSPMLRGDEIETRVWADVERFLRNPGDILAELSAEGGSEGEAAIAEAERTTIGRALDDLAAQRTQVLGLTIRGRLSAREADAELDRIDAERAALERRLAALDAPGALGVDDGVADLLEEARRRIDAGLSDEQRQEIVRLLVKASVHAESGADGKQTARAVIDYRFPRFDLGVLQTRTGTGSSRR